MSASAYAAALTQEKNRCQVSCSSRKLWLFNGALIACATVLVLLDQKGPFGDAAKWFFCALIFSSLKGFMRLFIA